MDTSRHTELAAAESDDPAPLIRGKGFCNCRAYDLTTKES